MNRISPETDPFDEGWLIGLPIALGGATALGLWMYEVVTENNLPCSAVGLGVVAFVGACTYSSKYVSEL